MSLTAQFNTLCHSCEEWVRPGDEIAVGVHGTTHFACDPDAVPTAWSKPAGAACGTCWQIPAVSGVCGCDE